MVNANRTNAGKLTQSKLFQKSGMKDVISQETKGMSHVVIQNGNVRAGIEAGQSLSLLASIGQSNNIKFALVPTGKGGTGTLISTSRFTVDNIPPVFSAY